MTENNDCIVIGGGAAGIFCAIFAARKGKKVVIVEKNKILGKKLLITGKGRCNVTNKCDDETFFSNVVSNPSFLRSAYSDFTCDDTISFFENLGVELKVERGNRVFPKSDRSADIVKALREYIKELKIKIVNGEAEDLIVDGNKIKGIILKDNSKIYSSKVVIATGGISYKSTGSTGKGYELSRKYGHTVTPLKAALVPVELNETSLCCELQGLSLKNIKITVLREEKQIYEDFGELIFTHFGISGPTVLSASSFVKPDDTILIDLKPALDKKTLDKRICSDFIKYANKNFINSLNDLLPLKMIKPIVILSSIPADKKVNVITKQERQNLVDLLKNIKLTVKGLRPIEEAVITSGGVSVKEINPKTMESKIIKGLYFAGEVIDVDAYTGGFNLQIAFSTGFKAGQNI